MLIIETFQDEDGDWGWIASREGKQLYRSDALYDCEYQASLVGEVCENMVTLRHHIHPEMAA